MATKQMRDLRIPGLALGIVQGDQIVHLKGFGQAGPDGRPVTPQTPFQLAITQLNGGRFGDTAILSPAGIAEMQRPVTPHAVEID